MTTHDITLDCPLACLAPLLSPSASAALAAGLRGPRATVGQVIDMSRQGRLKDIRNIGTGRTGQIRWRLTQTGLIQPGDSGHDSWWPAGAGLTRPDRRARGAKMTGERPAAPEAIYPAFGGHHQSCTSASRTGSLR